MSDSKFVQADPASERTYQQTGFDPATADSQLSYTSNRVAKPVYNTYEPGRYEVSGYITDWAQYDGRLQEDPNPANAGRGADLAQLLANPTAYDRVVVQSAAIVGDRGEKQQVIARAAEQLGRTAGQVTFIDPWGDCQAYTNCGFAGWRDIQLPRDFQQEKVQGLLGGLRELAKRSTDAGRTLKVAFSIGGWSMSGAFHQVARDRQQRTVFVDSVVDVFQRFPMFDEVDIDWEYPGVQGAFGNEYSEEDPANYAALIGELRRALDGAGRRDAKIGIALSSDTAVLRTMNVPALVASGADQLNVMTYDFFGTPWAAGLDHHAGIYSNPDSTTSLDGAVQYLLKAGITSRSIHIGWASYGRSARGATVTSISPLAGTCDTEGRGLTLGTFESGVTEWPDIITNYLDLETGQGRNGYTLYTDTVANADFLYNHDSRVFISLDTPRTVKAKAEYVVQHNLGGMFAWQGDLDNGLLLNAAREGLGQKLTEQTIAMEPLYTPGSETA
ncbi:glycosyl hydrolase family 18 protein [Streptomyces sp. NPDC050516]|uniref:glycosyl hydrolase family 18 protein n=1 Tax=Streptomyces sp. NPDC050516 TaxID=3365621 RepID=UPI0037B9301C